MLRINGFHTAVTGNTRGIGEFIRKSDEAGVPVTAYCADGTASLMDVQAVIHAGSKVPHVSVWRKTSGYPFNPGETDIPSMSGDPYEAGRRQIEWAEAHMPPELDRSIHYIECINEPGGSPEAADWIGKFCFGAASLAIERGWKFCGPGYSSGVPSLSAWDTPGMQQFLKLASKHKGQIAVALHEYSFTTADIMDQAPYKVGRFRFMNEACTRNGFEPPHIIFTEWGWAERDVPDPARAMEDIRRVHKELYAAAPNIIGAAIWALDGGWSGLDDKTNKLIWPLHDLMVNLKSEPVQPPPPHPDEPARIGYVVRLLPQDTTLEELESAVRKFYPQRNSFTFSHDDAYATLFHGSDNARLIAFEPERWDFDIVDWFESKGIRVETESFESDGPVVFTHWPTNYYVITQPFGANPENYAQFGLPGHEGIDIKAPFGDPYYAIGSGVVTRVSDRRSDGSPSAYGWHVIVDHGSGVTSLYAHATPEQVVKVGQRVSGGQILAYSGDTGNSSGPHLHLTLKIEGEQTGKYPPGYVDPFDYLSDRYFRYPERPRMQGWLWTRSMHIDEASGLAVAEGNLNMRVQPTSASARLRVVEMGEPIVILDMEQSNGYLLCEVYNPESASAVDMVPYFWPQGERGELYVLRNNWGGGDESVQLQAEGARSYVVKNMQWEMRRLEGEKIFLHIDTSPGNGEYYTISSTTGWMPRRWNPGDTFTRTERVSFHRKSDCQLQRSYSSSSLLKFHELHVFWSSGYGIELEDVVELHWVLNGVVEEKYFYAPGLGLVGWENRSGKKSSICELSVGDTRPLERESGCFGS